MDWENDVNVINKAWQTPWIFGTDFVETWSIITVISVSIV